jgi:hypothetical protein
VTIRYQTGAATFTNAPLTATPPVVLDLDGDGVEFLSRAAGVTYDYDSDGVAESTAWASADDGILAFDANGDRQATGSEIVFAAAGSGFASDLDGVREHDSNHDGVLDANDADFARFGVWQDANANGVSEAGEFRSLGELGITSLSLVSDSKGYVAANGDVLVSGEASFVRGGTSFALADAAFATASLERMAARTAELASTTAAAGAFMAVAAAVTASLPAAAADFAPAASAGDETAAPATLQSLPASSYTVEQDADAFDGEATAASQAPAMHASEPVDDPAAPTLATAGGHADAAVPAGDFAAASDLAASPFDGGGVAGLSGDAGQLMDALLLAAQAAGAASAADGAGQHTQDLASVEEAFSDTAASQLVDAVVDHFVGAAPLAVDAVTGDGALAALFALAPGGGEILPMPFDALQVIEDMSAMAAAHV